MIDRKSLLTDLTRLRRTLEADLREQAGRPDLDALARREWREAFDAKRTAETFDTFLDGAIDQAAVHWILASVFIRFLEDNGLIDRPFLSGPGERLELAQARQGEYVRRQPLHTDADYLLHLFAEAARLPGLKGLYDAAHNPLYRLPLSGDGAMKLIDFFRARDPDTGELRHDFTDPAWNTRFLGDLYQDLSEAARKRYALLQTPEFVEEWILDRTLDPAMREFGPTAARMIDPTCGSGHFLLGGFARILEAWRAEVPDLPPAALAQRALDAVAGVDLNPFAVEIARFRLLLVALRAAGETRLAAAPDFRFQLAVGDSLLHGRQFGGQRVGGQRDMAHELDDGFQRRLRHHYADEDTAVLDAVLGRQYHAVVGNPPYITPKDPAMRDAYRELYVSCHMKYGLGAPFVERFFDLALRGEHGQPAGFVGLIVANSFMKREFGAKLIEQVLPQLDLTHVVDCSGAYIPGHGTPTVILFGRNQAPVSSVVRTVRGVRGEPGAPEDPARGLVWSAILAQTDQAISSSEFISSEDTLRASLARHPWNMGGGGALEVQEAIEQGRPRLVQIASAIGIASVSGADDVFLLGGEKTAHRLGVKHYISFVEGDAVRDYRISPLNFSVWPHNKDFAVLPPRECEDVVRYMWRCRATVSTRRRFGVPMIERGMSWYEFQELYAAKMINPLSITFAEVATHNHFILDRGGSVFGRTAPVVKLPLESSENDHLGLLGLLNSSTACFWLKQVCHNKGATVDAQGARQRTDPFEDFYQLNGTRVEQFPVATEPPIDLGRRLEVATQYLIANLPSALCATGTLDRESLDRAQAAAASARGAMIALQEELDWRCYRLYGLIGDSLEYAEPPTLELGERAFEIAMARRMAAGELETSWFERHGSTPITEVPNHWPDDYRALVERRIALIGSDQAIGLIERPEYKRRWSTASWVEQEREALKGWLLDRLEDRRYWPQDGARVISTNGLADFARADGDFMAVAALYVGREDFDPGALVADLVERESVPYVAAMRYLETGLRKRADWEATWTAQRREDAIDAEVAADRNERLLRAARMMADRAQGETDEAFMARLRAFAQDPEIAAIVDRQIAEAARARKVLEVGAIPTPPKYVSKDFRSANIWRLRGPLDVPKERFVSFPLAARDADGSLPVLWAGYGDLEKARALAAWLVERKDADGWPAERLAPMLAGLLELTPWLKQWHNALDTETGLRMGDFFEQFVVDEARDLGLTLDDVRGWAPPAPARRGRGRARRGEA